MKMLLASLTAMSLLASGVAASADPDEAYMVDRRQFKKTYKTIALAPVYADPYLKMPSSIADLLEKEVTAYLKKEGFTVIPSSVLAGIRSQMTEQVGGYATADASEVDVAKAKAVRDHSVRELWFKEDFDALVSIRVTITRMPIESDRIEWDGAKQKIETKGRGRKYTAQIPVSSVSVGFYDVSDKPLYLAYGGLEALMYRDGEQLQPFDVDRFFKDEKRIRRAAKLAVDPI